MNASLPKSINIGLPPQIKSSRNSLFEVGLLVIVCVVFGWFIVLPKKAAVYAKSSHLADLQSQANTTAQNLKILDSLVAQLQSHPQEIKKLDEALPLEGKITKLQILIGSLAQSTGVTVGDISVSGKTDGVVAGDTALLSNPFGASRSLKTLSGSLYVIGNFSQLETLLKKIESSARIIEINSLDIGSGLDNNLNLKIGFSAYYLAP